MIRYYLVAFLLHLSTLHCLTEAFASKPKHTPDNSRTNSRSRNSYNSRSSSTSSTSINKGGSVNRSTSSFGIPVGLTKFFAPCSPGLEEIVTNELVNARIGAVAVVEKKGGCEFWGTRTTAFRAAMWLRSANAVWELLAEEDNVSRKQVCSRIIKNSSFFIVVYWDDQRRRRHRRR